jgi:hypothetical protein
MIARLADRPPTDLGLLGRSRLRDRLTGAGLPLDVRLPDAIHPGSASCVEHTIAGVPRYIAQPCTFTPFASARPCSARCRFCSETLVDEEATTLSATLRPGPGYAAELRAALAALRGVPLGLSLSGLEATDDEDWLHAVLDEVLAHEAAGGEWTDKVLYSNANGFAQELAGRRLLRRLEEEGLDRVEISRHHPVARRNQQIMRFRDDARVRDAEDFARAVSAAVDHVPLRFVCVLQRGGVSDLAGALAYIRWARSLGVRDVVFRELSRLGDRYVDNAPRRYVAQSRAPIEELLDELWPEGRKPAAGFVPEELVAGYYYWNLAGSVGDVRVTFETSDYTEMKSRHHSGVVHKLVFHANGNLCADWDPNTEVLLRSRADGLVRIGG